MAYESFYRRAGVDLKALFNCGVAEFTKGWVHATVRNRQLDLPEPGTKITCADQLKWLWADGPHGCFSMMPLAILTVKESGYPLGAVCIDHRREEVVRYAHVPFAPTDDYREVRAWIEKYEGSKSLLEGLIDVEKLVLLLCGRPKEKFYYPPEESAIGPFLEEMHAIYDELHSDPRRDERLEEMAAAAAEAEMESLRRMSGVLSRSSQSEQPLRRAGIFGIRNLN